MDTIIQWITNNGIALLSLILAPTLAWWFSRRKTDAEAKKIGAEGDSILVNSSGELIEKWQIFATEMKAKYDECGRQNQIQIDQNNNLLKKNNILIDQNKTLTNKIELFEDKLKAYVDGATKIFNLMLLEIEKTNPEFAKDIGENFESLSKIFQRAETHGRKTTE